VIPSGSCNAELVGVYALLRAVHSGHVGDYATWLTVGLTGLGAAFAYAILGK
jgi:hypothetical protein